MNILQKAAIREMNWKANLSNISEYKPFTTFFSDMTIAELCSGLKGVQDTFNNVVKSWKSDYKYFTEFVLVLNHKIWEHYGKGPGTPNYNEPMARLYDSLWRKAVDIFFATHGKNDKATSYYYEVTD